MNKKIIYILLLLLIGNITFSQTSISVTPRQDTVLIGDHILVDVVLYTDNINDIESIDFTEWKSLTNLAYRNDTINLEEETDISFIGENDWGVSDSYFSTPVGQIEEWFKIEKSLSKPVSISIYDFGVWSIPPPTIVTKSGKRYPRIEPAMVFVLPADLGAVQDSVALMPIKDIIAEGQTWEDYKIWLYILGLIILAPFLIKLFWGRKKHEVEEIIEEEIFIPAHEKALSALQSLKGKELWQSGNIKEYQSELTVIVRRYLEDRFDVNALEMTTDDINRELRNKDFDTKHSSTLQRILTIADLVKFAKATPPVEINAEFMDEAESFVNNTKKDILVEEQSNTEKSIEISQSEGSFQKTKSKVYKWSDLVKSLALPILLIIVGGQFIKDAFSEENSQRKQELRQLIETGSTAKTKLNETYNETTVKISKLKTKVFEFTYEFKVSENYFSGKARYSKLPEDLNVTVTYLNDNPTINSSNPTKELTKLAEKTDWTAPLIGLLILLIGLYLLFRFYSNHVKRNKV